MELTHINSNTHTYTYTIYTFIQPPAFRRKTNLTILIFKQYGKVWQKVGKHCVNPHSTFSIQVQDSVKDSHAYIPFVEIGSIESPIFSQHTLSMATQIGERL
jgi:hypothetical protein